MTQITEYSVRCQIHDAGFKIAASQLHPRDMNKRLTQISRAWDSFNKGSKDVFTDGNYTFVAPRTLSKKRSYNTKKGVSYVV